MISKQDLLDAGYRYHHALTSLRHTEDLYQKRILDERGLTRYFVNFWWYTASESFPMDSWESEVQFNVPGGDTFDVKTHCWRDATIAEVEAFFDSIHKAQGCLNYDREDEPASEERG